MRLCAQLFLVVAIFSANLLFAQSIESQYDWVLKRDRSAVKVYTAKVTGSKYRAVRARMLVDGRIESLVGLVKDLENCSKWAVMCKSARLEKRNTHSIICHFQFEIAMCFLMLVGRWMFVQVRLA